MKKHIVYDSANKKASGINLDRTRIKLNTYTNGIIALEEMSGWQGTARLYKEVGYNVAECLYTDSEVAEWYVDSYGRFVSEQYHNSGVSKIRFMEWKDDVTEEQKEMVLDKLYFGKATERTIRRYMQNLGYKVANVYGWKLNRKGAR